MKDLKPRRKEEQALATITAVAGSDATFAAALLRDRAVLAATADAARAALADFTELENLGLTARFYSSNDPAGVPDRTEASALLAHAPDGAQKSPAGADGGIAAVWSGFVDAPKTGFYDIAVVMEAGVVVALEIDGARVTMAQGADGWSNQSPISLTAGRLVAISLKVKGLKSALAVRWATNGVAWQSIPAACLYSQTLLE